MAEGHFDVESSDDNLSDDESWTLRFDIPNNDQTWLYCPKGIDPMSVIDLTEIWTAPQRFFEAHQPSLKTNTHSFEVKGEAFDSRTFTRPKKQNSNTPNNGSLRVNLQKSKLKQIWSTAAEEISLKDSNAYPIKKSASVECLIISDSLNNSDKLPNNVAPTLINTKYNNNSFLFSECSLIENCSFPSLFFSSFSLSSNSINIAVEMETDIFLPQVIHNIATSKCVPKWNDNNNHEDSSSKKNLVNLELSNSLKLSSNNNSDHSSFVTPPDYEAFQKPHSNLSVSTPKHIKPNKHFKPHSILNSFEKNGCLKKSEGLNTTYDLSENCNEVRTHDVPGADTLHNSVTATVLQKSTQKEEEVVLENDNNHRYSNEDSKITPDLINMKSNETYSCKDDSNPNKTLNILDVSDRPLIEDTSCPSGFFCNLSLMGGSENLAHESSTKMDSTFKGKELKSDLPYAKSSLKIKNQPKDTNSLEKVHLSNKFSSEKVSPRKTGFAFRPSLVSTPKLQEFNHHKEATYKANVETITEENSLNNNNMSLELDDLLIDDNSSQLNTTITLKKNKAPCLNETVVLDNCVYDNLDNENANFLDKDYNPTKAASVESVNVNLKASKEKDDDSAPDSCYSSSSNIRSLGDVCGTIQPQESVNYSSSMRKSLSHDSLLSQDCYKANSSQFKRHESELSLIQRSPVEGSRVMEKVNPDSKKLSTMSKIVRGGRSFLKPKGWHKSVNIPTNLQLPRFSVRNIEFENINPNENYGVDKRTEEQSVTSGSAMMKSSPALSKIPTLRTRIPKPQSQIRKFAKPQ